MKTVLLALMMIGIVVHASVIAFAYKRFAVLMANERDSHAFQIWT